MNHSTRALSKSIAALLATVVGAHMARAAVFVWDGGAGTNELTTSANWSPDGTPSPATPDTMQWNGTAAGPLALVFSTNLLAGATGNTGLNLDVTATQTAALSIDAATANGFRMNGLTVAAGAGPVSLGDGAGVAFGMTLGGVSGATHTWTNNSSNPVTLGSEVAIGLGGGGTHTLSLNGAGGYVFNNAVGGALVMTARNNATVTFNATSTYSGNTSVGTGAESAVVKVNANNALGTGTITFGNNATAGRLELLGGRTLSNAITLTARTTNTVAIQSVSGANTLSGAVTLGTGGGVYRLQVDAGSSLTLSNATAISGGAITATRTVTLGGAGAGFVTGAIVNGTAGTVVAITKSDAGTWTFSGANTYTGTTTVSGGTLITSPAQTGATTVTVADGATFGVKLAAPGTTFTASTITTGATAGASLLFDTGALGNPTAAMLSATTFTPTAPTVLRVTGTGLSVGNNLPLLDYTGAIGGLGFAGLSLALPARVTGVLVDNTTDSRVDFNITQFEQVKWQGNTNADWDADTDGTGTNGSQNWLTTVNLTPTKYLQGTGGTDAVNFTDSATGSTAINIAVPVTPGATVFSNSVANYIFASTGGFGIGGVGSLVKNGTASVTLNTANTYSGGTTLNAGTLNVGNASALGTGPVTINGGTLDNSSGSDLTMTGNNALNVNGDFSFTGTKALDLGAGAVTIGGGGTDRAITVSANALSLGEIKAAAHGINKLGAGTLIVGSVGAAGVGSVISGTLNVGAGTVQINRSGAASGASGDFTAGGLSGSGTVTNGASVERWLFVNTTGDFNFTGTLANGGSGGLGFNKQGGGTQTLSGTNSYTGQTTVGGGTLRIAAPLDNSPIAVSGGALSLEVANAVSQNSITVSGTGTLAQTVDNAITGSATLVAQKSLTLSRPNSYSGETVINAGTGTTVAITNAAAAGSGRLNAATGATAPVFALHINGGGVIPMANSIGGNSNLVITVDVDNNGSGSNGLIQLSNTGIIGNSTLNVTGNNGYGLAIAGLNSSAGGAGATVLNPTSAKLFLGSFTSSSTAAKTLQLDGTTAGNVVGGNITNGTATSVALAKANTSTWTLSGSNTYTGATSVAGGELIVTGSLTGTSSVNVAAGATLSGNGSIVTSGNITLSANSFLEPGNGNPGNIGMFFFSTGGLLDLSAATGDAGALKFDLAQPGASDFIVLAAGALNIGANALGFDDFNLNAVAGFANGTYTLIDSPVSIVGTLDPADLEGTIGTYTGMLGFSGDGTDLVLTVVPEPGSVALLFNGAALLGLRRCRQTVR